MYKLIFLSIIILKITAGFGQTKRDRIMQVDSIFHQKFVKYTTCDAAAFDSNFKLYKNGVLLFKDKSISKTKVIQQL
jgi:hypothetical protein